MRLSHVYNTSLCGLYYKPITIVNDDSSIVNKLETSLHDDTSVIIYNCKRFKIQASVACIINLLLLYMTTLALSINLKLHLLTTLESSFTIVKWLYYKPITIVNDNSSIIKKLETSLIDDARVIVYDRHMFIVQATGLTRWKPRPIDAGLPDHFRPSSTAQKTLWKQKKSFMLFRRKPIGRLQSRRLLRGSFTQ